MNLRGIKKIIIWGAGGQAKVIRECLGYYGIEVAAVFDSKEGISSPLLGVPVFYGMDGLREWLSKEDLNNEIGFIVAIGGKGRYDVYTSLIEEGLKSLTISHPTAFIASDASIGNGSQLLAKSAVCSEAVIGKACIINTAATVDHECILGDGVHICPGSHLSGCVKVGNNTMIGTGSVVLPRITIGEGVIVGSGAVVTKDIPDGVVVIGNPATAMVTEKEEGF